jgi:hypothetical protein
MVPPVPRSGATREALRSRPRRRRRPRILPSGVMEYWSIGVLRQSGIAPRVRGVGSAFRARLITTNPGLKPWAMLCNRFAVKFRKNATLIEAAT